MLESEYVETAREHAADLDSDRRERLARELATRRLLKQRAQEDVWSDGDNSSKVGGNNDTDARGLLIEDGDGARSGSKVNPAHIAAHKHKRRTREIAEELSLWAGFQ